MYKRYFIVFWRGGNQSSPHQTGWEGYRTAGTYVNNEHIKTHINERDGIDVVITNIIELNYADFEEFMRK